MAFKIHSTDGGRVPSIEYLPVSAITTKAGMALTQSSGKLAIAAGTTAPTYISMEEAGAAHDSGDIIPVVRVQKDMIFETTLSTAGTSLNLGDKVTLHATNGMEVTATTSNGVAEIIDMDGTAVGSAVRVRF